MDEQTIVGFSALFAGRRDVYGAEHGAAVRTNPFQWEEELWSEHLAGLRPIGVYPLRDDNTVKWGCVDWDQGYDESWPDALNTHNVLSAFGVTSWIERSRSKGWHLWVFAEDWVPATIMRDALWAACETVGAPTKEVNPKQVELSEVKPFGNYVRLPYPGGDVPSTVREARQVMVSASGDTVWVLAPFVTSALAQRTPTTTLEKLAARRAVPDRHTDHGDIPIAPTELDAEIVRKLDGLAYTILMEGPAAGTEGDRSGTLFKLGTVMWDTGRVTKDEAWAVMVDSDRRWGKYQERDDLDALWVTFQKAFQPQP